MKKSLILLDYAEPTIEHLLALQTVKQNPEWLSVGLYTTPDKKLKLKSSTFEQYMWITSNNNIDEVVPYCTEVDLHNIMNFYPFKEIWVGKQYSTTSFTGKDICEQRGIDIKYFDQHITFSYHTV